RDVLGEDRWRRAEARSAVPRIGNPCMLVGHLLWGDFACPLIGAPPSVFTEHVPHDSSRGVQREAADPEGTRNRSHRDRQSTASAHRPVR
ncbi:hypothetical protein, partial [Serratia sp. OLDL1]|uniref:hypothetical protein n=1 Tax=Serratia sp. OLDL1 TaxID=1914909 RepID=UPI001A7E0615